MLRPYQIEDLAHLIANPMFMNLSEPGTGKTPTSCVYTKYLQDHKNVSSVWVQPKAIMDKNRRELLTWTGWDPEDVKIVDGTPAEVQAAMQSQAKVFLMGYARFEKEALKLPERVKAVIADEVHLKGFSGPESARTARLFEFMKKQGEYYVPMSGTLYNGKPDSCYPSIALIEPRYYGNYKNFQNFHYDIDLWTQKRTGYRNLDKIQQILLKHGVRRTFESVYGKEKVVVQVEPMSMAPEQKDLYDTFQREALLELEKFFVDGSLPGVAFARARQILEHPNRFPDLTDPKNIRRVNILPEGERCAKLDQLEIHLSNHQNTGKPLAIFSALVPQQELIYQLVQSMGMTVGLMNGATTQDERKRIDAEFVAGRIQILVCSPEVAGIGWNWQNWANLEVEHCIFASMDYMDSTYFQAYRRFVRGKRNSPLLVTVLMYPDTVDERVWYILKRKSIEAHIVDPTRSVLEFI